MSDQDKDKTPDSLLSEIPTRSWKPAGGMPLRIQLPDDFSGGGEMGIFIHDHQDEYIQIFSADSADKLFPNDPCNPVQN